MPSYREIQERQERDLERIKDAFMDMLSQSCAIKRVSKWNIYKEKYDLVFTGYDSMCLSAYENALDLAVELGWIKKEEVLR